MNTKLRKLVSELCKDMGLTDKALDELTEVGSQGLKEDASEEDVKKVADSLVIHAKMIQAEITRKMSKKNPPTPPDPKQNQKDEDNLGEFEKLIAKQLEPFKTQLDKLQQENEALKAEKTKADRSNLISQHAKKMGIPDYLIKRVSIADDADIEKELSEFKQELINNSLLPKDAGLEESKADEVLKSEAKAWADALPNL